MKMGKYVVRKGRFVHVDDMRKRSVKAFFSAVGTSLVLWYFILVGIGVIPIFPFL